MESVVLPRHEDFEKIYQNFIDQYGEEGEQKYFAWLNEHGYDDTKPMPKKESFSWVGDIQAVPGSKNLIRGEALHPLKTLHPEEWPGVRVYLEEELQKSAHTLADKPLLLDHSMLLDGKVTGAQYEDGAIEYAAQLNDPRILDLIRTGDIKHCSVEFEWESLEHVNGVAPKGIKFTALSLLKNFAPGDPLSTVELVEVWEGIVQHLKEAKMKEQPNNQTKNPKTSTQSGKEMQPQTLEGRITFLETSKLLKEQQLSKEEIEAKIQELTKTRQALDAELQQIAENEQPKRDEIWQKMDLINAQLRAYEDALAALIAGTASPPEGGSTEEGKLKEQDNQEPPKKDEHGCLVGKERYDEELGKCVPVEAATEKKNVVGEAILVPGDSFAPSFVVSVEALESVLPPLQAERSMSWGAQRFVQDIKHLIHEAKEAP